MALLVSIADPADAARVVDALLLAAEVETLRNPALCRRYRLLADDFGAGLDAAVPVPSGWPYATADSPAVRCPA